MTEQLLSADPSAGLLSTDPAAGRVPVVLGPHPEARLGAPSAGAPVTLGDLIDNPVGSFQQIGRILGRDATDPKLWMTLALQYFGPKVLPYVGPAIGGALRAGGRGAIRGTAAVGDLVAPDVIGVVSPRLGRAVDVAQRLRTGLTPVTPPPPTPLSEVVSPRPAAPAAEPVAGSAATSYTARGSSPRAAIATPEVLAPPAAPAPPPYRADAPQALIAAAERAEYPITSNDLKLHSVRVAVRGENPDAVVAELKAAAAARAAAPAASPPGVPAPPAAAATPLSAPTPPPPSGSPTAPMSPQRIQNELGLAARRAGLKLTEPQYAEAALRVQGGETPVAAVTAVAPPPPPPKLKISAAEMGTYTALRKLGTSHQDAMAAVQAQRDLVAALGTPSSEAVRQAVADRNVSGRWPGATPGE
jgi:hypothetical protein